MSDFINIDIAFDDEPPTRNEKGKSLIDFPSDFVVIDTETTGLYSPYDDMIEFAALKVRNNAIESTFVTLINPGYEISEFIADYTGITNDMLKTAPTAKDVIPAIYTFIGEDIIVGHNVNFDINFIYDALSEHISKPIKNDYIDTMRISRKALPALEHHRLSDIAEALDVAPTTYHRALADCHTTYECFLKLRDIAINDIGLNDFILKFKKKHHVYDLTILSAESDDFDTSNPFYGNNFVFTGALDIMTRTEAAQIVVNLGGKCENGVTKKTNFLVLGNKEYCNTVKDGKSAKMKKAEEYKLKGQNIDIIPAAIFFEMLEEEVDISHYRQRYQEKKQKEYEIEVDE